MHLMGDRSRVTVRRPGSGIARAGNCCHHRLTQNTLKWYAAR